MCKVIFVYTVLHHKFLEYGGFLKWWYPTTMGFPTKNGHFGVFWGYHHLRKHPYVLNASNQNDEKMHLAHQKSCQVNQESLQYLLPLSYSEDVANVLAKECDHDQWPEHFYLLYIAGCTVPICTYLYYLTIERSECRI